MAAVQIEMSMAALLLFIIIFISLVKNSMSIRNSIAWLLLPIVFLFIAIFPEPLGSLANWLANFIFLIAIALLIILCFFLTITISRQQIQITKLIQEISIIKYELKKQKHHDKKN